MISVALIGCGRIAGHHARSIRSQGLTLGAVCDLDIEKANAYSKEFDVPAYSNYREMLTKHTDIDVVAVITPSGMHYEHGMEIVTQFKRHLVLEKPTCLKASHLRELYAAAAKEGRRLFPVFQNRYNKAIQRVRQGILNGELGPVRLASVRVRWCRPQRYYDLAPWRGTYAQDGGALTNQGIHHVDLLRYLGGEVKAVQCAMRTLGAEIEVEDTATGVVQFESGAVGTLEVTTAARPIDFEASLSLVCEKGLAQVGGIAVNELQVYTPDPTACATESEDFSGCVYGYGHEALYRDLAADLRGGTQYPVSESDNVRSIELLQAFYRADEQGIWIKPGGAESTRLGRDDEKLAAIYRVGGPGK